VRTRRELSVGCEPPLPNPPHHVVLPCAGRFYAFNGKTNCSPGNDAWTVSSTADENAIETGAALAAGDAARAAPYSIDAPGTGAGAAPYSIDPGSTGASGEDAFG